MCWGLKCIKGSGEVIRASATYSSGWGSFVLLKMDCARVAQGGSLSMLHQAEVSASPLKYIVMLLTGDPLLTMYFNGDTAADARCV